MTVREFRFTSATGVGTICARSSMPEGEAKAILVIHHGMAEHKERYDVLTEYLTTRGVGVYIHDMAGHGQSCAAGEPTGWFGSRDGWKGLLTDYRTMAEKAAAEHPGVPLFLMGHSMGSFICRLYAAMIPEPQPAGYIFMGTGGPSPVAGVGIALAEQIGKARGQKHKSRLLDRMAFGTYNKRCEGRTPFDWLTRDTEIVDRYIADPECGFLFTVQGMADLGKVNRDANTAAWFQAVPKEARILLTGGEEDPVGEYGQGVRAVADRLKESGHDRVTLKLYPGCRHEILNETNREQVMADLTEWMTDMIDGKREEGK